MIDWTSFIRKVRIRSSQKVVLETWINTELITRWFLCKCVISNDKERKVIEVGDQVLWEWHNYPNPMTVVIKELTQNHLVFTFDQDMEVAIDLIQEEGFTILTLRQYNIPEDESSKMNFYAGCSQAWSSWLLNLKSYIEFGNILHDKSLGNREDLFDYVNT